MLLYYSQTVSAIATATCDLRAAALLLLEAITQAPSCRAHSVPSQLARARAVGLVTGPHARGPRTHSQWVVSPGRTPHRTGGWGWESARPWTPHTQARGAPPRAPSCRPHGAQSQLARARAVALVTGPHTRIPRTHSQWVVGPGRTPQRTGGRVWESARTRTPQSQARGAPPRAPSCRPHGAQSQLPRARAVGFVTGPHTRTPAPTASGWWAPAARPRGRAVGGGRAPDPGRPTPRQEAPPPGALVPPPKRAKPARKSARCGVGDGSTRPHPPHPQPRPHAPRARPKGGRQPQARQGRNGTGPPPPPSKPDSARDRGRTCGGARTAWNGPTSAQHRNRARCARHTDPGRGVGRERRESASARTRKGHAGRTRRATGPSPRNAQTAWNGVPASEDRGRPDGTARHTQRGKRGARRGKQGRHKTRAPRTHDQGTATAKAVVAHRATHQPHGYAASAPAHGGPTGDKPVARARQHRHPGQPRTRGATQWVSACSYGC